MTVSIRWIRSSATVRRVLLVIGVVVAVPVAAWLEFISGLMLWRILDGWSWQGRESLSCSKLASAGRFGVSSLMADNDVCQAWHIADPFVMSGRITFGVRNVRPGWCPVTRSDVLHSGGKETGIMRKKFLDPTAMLQHCHQSALTDVISVRVETDLRSNVARPLMQRVGRSARFCVSSPVIGFRRYLTGTVRTSRDLPGCRSGRAMGAPTVAMTP